MLGTPHIRMIWHGLYRSLPHRRGEGVDPRQELRRQVRFAMRNPQLIADLFRLHYHHDLAAAQRLYRRRTKLLRELGRPISRRDARSAPAARPEAPRWEQTHRNHRTEATFRASGKQTSRHAPSNRGNAIHAKEPSHGIQIVQNDTGSRRDPQMGRGAPCNPLRGGQHTPGRRGRYSASLLPQRQKPQRRCAARDRLGSVLREVRREWALPGLPGEDRGRRAQQLQQAHSR